MAASAVPPAAHKPEDDASETAAALDAMMARYAGFGDKASGGPGDEAAGAWLQAELEGAGYRCERQTFEVPYFTPTACALTCAGAAAEVIPQAPVVTTTAAGVSGSLRLAAEPGDLSGAIALVVLPYKRWIGLGDPQAARPIADALARGAAAAVIVTTGPSGHAVALNNTPQGAHDRPLAVLAPNEAAPFLAAAARGDAATLVLDGEAGRRPAWNLIGRLERGAGRTLVMTTPRSGWFGCAAERGSGLAAWLGLARWLAGRADGPNLEVVATSGHEYSFLGGERYLHAAAPPPDRTWLWIHIGASLAARDWHDIGALRRPLPSADPQRVLTASPDLIALAREAFRGLPGLEAVYPADPAHAGGEMINVVAAGYTSTLGAYGVHRLFHTRADDLSCVSGALVQPVLAAYQQLLSRALDAGPA